MTPARRRPPDRRARIRRRRAARVAAWAARLAVVALALAVGIALGRALEEDPAPGRERTLVRTLNPQPLSPAPRTVTVTVEGG